MGREDLIKIFENTVWMCETNHKLKDKIIAKIKCYVDSDDNLCVDIIRYEEKAFKVRISNFSRRILYNWTTKDVVDKYRRFVMKYYFK